MATYKKKGSKSKSSRNKLEELENKSATAGIINTLDDGASKTEEWVATNQKYIFITIALVASLVFGYLGFDKFIQQPAEVNAMNEMHPAQIHFESANQTKNDSLFNLALNGADGKLGMIDIIENYSGLHLELRRNPITRHCEKASPLIARLILLQRSHGIAHSNWMYLLHVESL